MTEAAHFAFDHARQSVGISLPAACQVEFQRLTKLIQARAGKFQLLVIDCRDEPLRERIIAALAEVFAATRPAARLVLDVARQTTFAEVETLLTEAAAHHDIAHLLGAVQWFDTRQFGPARWESFNIRREALAQTLPANLLCWLNAEAIADMARIAGDLWAWRAGVFEFRDEDIAAPVGQFLSARDISLPDRRTLSERARRIGELRSALSAEPPLPDDSYFLLALELGELLKSIGRYADAENHYRDLARRFAHDPYLRAVSLGGVAEVLTYTGELDEALRIFREEELPIYEKRGAENSKALTYIHIADILVMNGKQDEALRILEKEVLPAIEHMGDLRAKAVTWGRIADILQFRGEVDAALRIRTQEELPVFEHLGDTREVIVTQGKIAGILRTRGELDAALALQEQCLPVALSLNDIELVAHIKYSIASLRLARGDHERGALQTIRDDLDEVYAISHKIGRPAFIGESGQLLAQVLALGGHQDNALRVLDEVEAAFRKLGREERVARVVQLREAIIG